MLKQGKIIIKSWPSFCWHPYWSHFIRPDEAASVWMPAKACHVLKQSKIIKSWPSFCWHPYWSCFIRPDETASVWMSAKACHDFIMILLCFNTTRFYSSYLLSKPSSTELNKYVLHLNFLWRKWITFTKSYQTITTQHSPFNKANPNRKPNPSTGRFIERARVLIPYIQGLSEQYRHTLAKYRVKSFL